MLQGPGVGMKWTTLTRIMSPELNLIILSLHDIQ